MTHVAVEMTMIGHYLFSLYHWQIERLTLTASDSSGYAVLIKLVDEVELKITLHISKLLSPGNPSFLPVLSVLDTPLRPAIVLPFVSTETPVLQTSSSAYDFAVLVLKV